MMYEKMYGVDASKGEFNLVSENVVNPVRIVIGSEQENEKELSESLVPLFVREAVFRKARDSHLIPSSVAVSDIDVAHLIRHTATIKIHTSLAEKPYVAPKGCALSSFRSM